MTKPSQTPQPLPPFQPIFLLPHGVVNLLIFMHCLIVKKNNANFYVYGFSISLRHHFFNLSDWNFYGISYFHEIEPFCKVGGEKSKTSPMSGLCVFFFFHFFFKAAKKGFFETFKESSKVLKFKKISLKYLIIIKSDLEFSSLNANSWRPTS